MLFEKEILKNKRVGVCACDAGGSNYILSFINALEISPILLLEGPAKDILPRKKRYTNKNKFIEDVDLVITGTSWSSNLEKEILHRCGENNIYTISILDHWVNFLDRFILNDRLILPDELIFFDLDAYQQGEKEFQNYLNKIKLSLTENYYLKELSAFNTGSIIRHTNKILFIDEPISGHYENRVNEFQFLKEFLEYKKTSDLKIYDINIRLHPSSKYGKYREIINSFSEVKELNKGNHLIADLYSYPIIIGIESMALAIAHKLNLETYTLNKEVNQNLLPFNIPMIYEQF